MTENQMITVGGREFEIPKLAARQNMVIDPIILGLLPVYAAIIEDQVKGLSKIDQHYYKDFITVVHTAITKKNPEITLEVFLDMPITLQELMGAFPAIAKQTGIFKQISAEEQSKLGEDKGSSSSLTGQS